MAHRNKTEIPVSLGIANKRECGDGLIDPKWKAKSQKLVDDDERLPRMQVSGPVTKAVRDRCEKDIVQGHGSMYDLKGLTARIELYDAGT
jgi:hypothetical protein